MGTNYYARIDTCPACKRYDEIHIGKYLYGWVFMFRAHDEVELTGSYHFHGPLKTAEDYREFTNYVSIFDEYGNGLPYGDFWRIVGSTLNEPQMHLYNGDYLSDGYRFSAYDFS